MTYVMVMVFLVMEEVRIIKNKYKKIIGVLNEKRFKYKLNYNTVNDYIKIGVSLRSKCKKV
jgi:hypothetical protein